MILDGHKDATDIGAGKRHACGFTDKITRFIGPKSQERGVIRSRRSGAPPRGAKEKTGGMTTAITDFDVILAPFGRLEPK